MLSRKYAAANKLQLVRATPEVDLTDIIQRLGEGLTARQSPESNPGLPDSSTRVCAPSQHFREPCLS